MYKLRNRAIALSLSLLAGIGKMFAQNKNVSDAFAAANTQLSNTIDSALVTFQYVCGLGALVSGCILFYNFTSGNQDAAKKTGMWLGGLIIFIVVLQMVKVFFFNKA